MLKQRLLTAAVLLPLVLWLVIFASPLAFGIALGLVVFLGGLEWARLGGLESRRWRVPYAAVLVLILVGLEWLRTKTGLYWLHVLAGVWWLVGLVWLIRWRNATMGRTQGASLPGLALGLFVLTSFWAALVDLRSGTQGPLLVLALLLLIWLADTAAYFAGRRWGRHKLAPGISPGKTLEGVYGALALLLLYGVALYLWGILPLPLWQLLLLCLISGIFSIVGDLFESLLKRRRGLKDSGHLLPGHGGVLDRIDSLLSAAPVFVLGLLWLGAL